MTPALQRLRRFPQGDARGPAKRWRFSAGAHRVSDVMPEPEPDPRRPLGTSAARTTLVRGGAGNRL